MTAINPDEPRQTEPAGTSYEFGHTDGQRALTDRHVLDTMNVELLSRLAALESDHIALTNDLPAEVSGIARDTSGCCAFFARCFHT